MKKHKDYLKKQLKNKKFRKAFDEEKKKIDSIYEICTANYDPKTTTSIKNILKHPH